MDRHDEFADEESIFYNWTTKRVGSYRNEESFPLSCYQLLYFLLHNTTPQMVLDGQLDHSQVHHNYHSKHLWSIQHSIKDFKQQIISFTYQSIHIKTICYQFKGSSSAIFTSNERTFREEFCQGFLGHTLTFESQKCQMSCF